MTVSRDAPYPPLELASRVFRLESWGDQYEAFERIGAQTKETVVDLLPDDWSFEGKRVLDFGCGAGRTLRQFLPEAEHAEFWGTDIDRPSIEWLQEALSPPLHPWACAVSPPMGLDYGSFDLIYAVSVFTHLTDNSIPWLLELHRLLKPGGLLIATYMGQWNYEVITGDPWDENRVGMNALRHNLTWDWGGPIVLMSDWWMLEHWGRAFEVLDVKPQVHNQSWPLLRKRDVELTTEDIERPGDDPREFTALRNNLRQVQNELVKQQESHEAALDAVRAAHEQSSLDQAEHNQARMDAVRADYERSSSWKVTRPLRAGGDVARSLRARRRGS